MKKILLLVLTTIFLLAITLVVYADPYTDLTYSMNSQYYEIQVPSSLPLIPDGSELSISVVENHTGSNVNITITGNHSNSSGWRLFNKYDEEIKFDVYFNGTAIVPGSTISVGRGGAKLAIIMNGNDLRFATNGDYSERLLFTLS